MSVIITGIGCHSSLGDNPEEILRRIAANHAEFNQITQYDTTGCKVCYGAESPSIDASDLPSRKIQKLVNRKDLLGIVAAHRAMRDAGLLEHGFDPDRAGVFVGSTSTQIGDFMPYFSSVISCIKDNQSRFDSAQFGSACLDDINPLAAVKVLLNGSLAHISQSYRLQGRNTNFMEPNISGLMAVAAGFEAIQSGTVDWCLAGSMFAPFDPFQISEAWHQGRLLSTNEPPSSTHIRPFDAGAPGTVYGEASAFLVLESAEFARKRKALRKYGSILSTASAAAGRASPSDAIIHALRTITQTSNSSALNLFTDGCGITDHDAVIADAMNRFALSSNLQLSLLSFSPWLGWCADAGGVLDIALSLFSSKASISQPQASPGLLNHGVKFQQCSNNAQNIVLRSGPNGQAAAIAIVN